MHTGLNRGLDFRFRVKAEAVSSRDHAIAITRNVTPPGDSSVGEARGDLPQLDGVERAIPVVVNG